MRKREISFLAGGTEECFLQGVVFELRPGM